MFEIVQSAVRSTENSLISPDVSICADCRRELFDPADRRYRYPFINCTNCGPRFTIIRAMPYDRPQTTMARFEMCAACRAEYDDPLNRRFHAQPIACPTCGPQVWLEVEGQTLDLPDLNNGSVFKTAGSWLKAGKILAVKGLGGFHLAVDPTNDAALATLRARKGRVDKPFAVMAADIEQVKRFAHLSPDEAALLQSKERPILILRKRKSGPLSDLVAPGNRTIGVMLPYTPLHMLLLAELSLPILVMTSANRSNEPDRDRQRRGPPWSRQSGRRLSHARPADRKSLRRRRHPSGPPHHRRPTTHAQPARSTEHRTPHTKYHTAGRAGRKKKPTGKSINFSARRRPYREPRPPPATDHRLPFFPSGVPAATLPSRSSFRLICRRFWRLAASSKRPFA